MKGGRVSGSMAAPRPAQDATPSHGRNEPERRWQVSGQKEAGGVQSEKWE